MGVKGISDNNPARPLTVLAVREIKPELSLLDDGDRVAESGYSESHASNASVLVLRWGRGLCMGMFRYFANHGSHKP